MSRPFGSCLDRKSDGSGATAQGRGSIGGRGGGLFGEGRVCWFWSAAADVPNDGVDGSYEDYKRKDRDDKENLHCVHSQDSKARGVCPPKV
jgi:hypothetical protein